MSEHLYPTHSGRPQSQAQDLTPYSAVSSFNLPATYDSTLMTPVSLTSSPSMPTKSASAMKQEADIKLSPTTMSPTYHIFCGDEEFANPRYNPPMKLKDPSGILQISAADSSFPASPYVCTSPYYGSFGVSATPHSARTTNSSPGVHQSPHLHSAGGLSSNDSHHSRQQTPASYRSNFQAPILIAPSPQTLRPATNYDRGPYRQNSLQPNPSPHSPPYSQRPPQGTFTQNLPMHPRGKKRKDPPSDYDAIMRSGEINPEEKLLLELSGRDKLPWKEVALKFNQMTKQTKRVAALQMRKKRLLERLRVWTDAETKSLTLAHDDYEKSKWSSISKGMLKHGSDERWSKEALQKKWNEMHPDQSSYTPEYEIKPEYEIMPRNRHRVSPDLSVGDVSTGNSCWSDEGNSSTHSLHDQCDSATLLSALSTATMDEVRNRALGNANAQIHLHQQQHQQMMFQQQHQHQNHPQNGWDSGP